MVASLYSMNVKSYLRVCANRSSVKRKATSLIIKNNGSNTLLGKKVSVKTSFPVGMDLEKVQKQGRDESTQEHYPIHLQKKYTADVG